MSQRSERTLTARQRQVALLCAVLRRRMERLGEPEWGAFRPVRSAGFYRCMDFVELPVQLSSEDYERIRAAERALGLLDNLGVPNTVDNGDGTYTHTWDFERPQSAEELGRRIVACEAAISGLEGQLEAERRKWERLVAEWLAAMAGEASERKGGDA